MTFSLEYASRSEIMDSQECADVILPSTARGRSRELCWFTLVYTSLHCYHSASGVPFSSSSIPPAIIHLSEFFVLVWLGFCPSAGYKVVSHFYFSLVVSDYY